MTRGKDSTKKSDKIYYNQVDGKYCVSTIRARLIIQPRANKLSVKILAAFSQPIYTIVSSSQLIHDPLVSLTDFFYSCAQADCKFTARFSSLLSFTSSFSRFIANG